MHHFFDDVCSRCRRRRAICSSRRTTRRSPRTATIRCASACARTPWIGGGRRHPCASTTAPTTKRCPMTTHSCRSSGCGGAARRRRAHASGLRSRQQLDPGDAARGAMVPGDRLMTARCPGWSRQGRRSRRPVSEEVLGQGEPVNKISGSTRCFVIDRYSSDRRR